MRFIFILLGAVLSTSGSIAAANAQQGDAAERRPTKASEDDFSIPAEPSSKFETDSENIFGFTEGTDTQKEGEREISVDGIGRVGKCRFGPAQLPSRDGPTPRMTTMPPRERCHALRRDLPPHSWDGAATALSTRSSA